MSLISHRITDKPSYNRI